ncbi:MAG: glycosyltransferase [Ruminococcaceae bacterium]|nr:glycosyltransferase [Oscillospiraceae bacterium]
MKKILIVNNNMKIGGVQKSLCNLLWALDGRYEITLLLFDRSGALLQELPPKVKVIACKSAFRFFGISQAQCKGLDKLKRGALAFLGRRFGRNCALKLIHPTQKTLPGTYDAAIAFLHNGNPHHFYGGVQDFVLRHVKARKKIAFLHCDYRLSDANHKINNQTIRCFDTIAACSDGCRRAFCEVLPELSGKCIVVRNCHRFAQIQSLAAQDTAEYPQKCFHLLTVARLAHEKGVERAIAAAAYLRKKGIDFRLHIVGSGAMRAQLQALTEREELLEQVLFYGEQENPYRFMKHADLLLMTSFHEAAPLVIEEAASLALPVLTTETTSSDEMVVQADNGFVCANSQEAIDETLYALLSEPSRLAAVRKRMQGRTSDNSAALLQFQQMLED